MLVTLTQGGVEVRLRKNGFSIIELLLTLSVITLLLAVATPKLPAFLEKNQGEKALIAIARAIHVGRTAAIKTGGTVTICRSYDASTCSGNWQDGLIVFTDQNIDRVINHTDQLLVQLMFNKLPGTIVWRAFQNRQYLQLNSRGDLIHQNGTFTWCASSGNAQSAHQLIVSGTGRIRFAVDSDGDGIRTGSNGLPLSCQNPP
jgi:type IV fimbrial biogenesis protein FimT